MRERERFAVGERRPGCAVVVASTRDCGVGRSYVPQRLVVSFAPSSRTRRWNARSSVRSRSRAAGLCGNQPVS